MPRNLASPQSRCLVFNMLAYHGGCKLKSPKGDMNRAVARFRGRKRNVLVSLNIACLSIAHARMALRSASQYLWVLDVLDFKRLNCTLLPFFSSYQLIPYLCGSKCQTCKCDMTNNCMISENKCNLMYIKHLQSYI